MNVYTYWQCEHCQSIIRGDSRTCPNCAAAIPNNVKYMMPDDPRVITAMREGKILIGVAQITNTDEKGIVSEVVDQKDERKDANWLCEYCGAQNFEESDTCVGCGAPRGEKTYFSEPKPEERPPEPKPEPPRLVPVNRVPEYKSGPGALPFSFGKIAAIVAAVLFLIWLFVPVSRVTTVDGFRWERTIDIEKFTLLHESGWSVPSGGRVTRTAQEVHHYDQVLDHYETKTRQVSERVLDGYDTSYRDLGNGQAEAVQTPRYRTEYHTETYQEPVYRQEPVYQTKYYYDIDKWVYDHKLTTSGKDQDPYWAETDLPQSVSSPAYGDERQGERHEKYTVIITDKKGNHHDTEYSFQEWNSFRIGDRLVYKSFRFSYQPLGDVQVEHAK